jgi:hypothetical protein
VGMPVGLYVRGTTALVAVSDFFRFVAADDGARPDLGSRLLAVDVSTPSQPRVLADVAIDGQVDQSRLVGDVLYLVSRASPSYGGIVMPVSTASTGSAGSGSTSPGAGGSVPAGTSGTVSVTSLDVSDPAHPTPVGRVEFPATGWSTHASVTAERVTISFAGWDYGTHGYGPSTRFQVVDISDPAGALSTGAEFSTEGQVQDRWGMDFDAGTGLFRAVVATGTANGGAALQIWSSPKPDAAAPLARLPIDVAESLTAARFDGSRVYLVTARRSDPLWAVDATDPRAPVLAGSLAMPGQLDFIEPRGDRLVALGHTDEAGQPFPLAVSLLDVTRLAAPQLLSRVAFGTGFGSVAAAPDDIRKAFLVLDAPSGGIGLVLVPVQGWDQSTYAFRGGTQLVDLERDALTLRGFLVHPGAVTRSFPVDDAATRLAALSDAALQTIDATNRDAPAELARIDLARSVATLAVVHGKAVELCGDWYRGAMELVITDALDPDAASPLARLSVAAPSARMIQDGDVAWLVAHDWTSGQAWLQAIDLGDPVHPLPRGRLDLTPDEAFASYPGRWGSGDEAVLVGHALVVHRMSWGCAGCAIPASAPAGVAVSPVDAVGSPASELRVYDLSDPDHPRRASTVALPENAWAWGLHASGSSVWLTHFESQVGDAMGRYDLDVIDVSDPSNPSLTARINVPGVFFAATPDGRRVYTVEAWWKDGTATSWLHALDLVSPGTARLAGSVAVDGYPSGIASADGFAWLVAARWSGPEATSRLLAVDLGSMAVTGDQAVPSDAAWVQTAAGGKLFLQASWYDQSVLVYGLADPAHPAFEQSVRTQGSIWDVVVSGGYAYLPSGPYGVPMISLAP